MWHSRPPRDPPPFMGNAILNFHFDFLNTSLIYTPCPKPPISTYYVLPESTVNSQLQKKESTSVDFPLPKWPISYLCLDPPPRSNGAA